MKKILITTLSLFLLFLYQTPVVAAGANTTANLAAAKAKKISVADYGANGKDTKDDHEAIQSALDAASKNSQAVTVTIPKGTYYLGDTIYVGSNTTIDATGATIISRFVDTKGRGSMVKTNHAKNCGSSCSHGGYKQAENITMIGGTWDRNSQLHASDTGLNNSIIYMAHCKGITIKNATFKNGSNHFLNLSASTNVTIEGCTLQDHVTPTTSSAEFWASYEKGDPERFQFMEAIHLDNATEDGEPSSFPYDGTVARDITIKNCTFKNLYAAVGNHHNSSVKTSNVKITDSRFDNITYKCLSIYSFDNVYIGNNKATNDGIYFTDIRYSNGISMMGNTVNNLQQGARVRSSKCSIQKNSFTMKKIADGEKNAIYVFEDSEVTIRENQISNAQTSGIRVKESKITITGNTISKADQAGIYIENNEKEVEISGNTISECKNSGIYSKNNAKVNISNNETKAEKRGIEINSCDDVLIEKNTSRSVSNSSIYVKGTSERMTKAIIVQNDSQTQNGDYDIFIDTYCHDCEVVDNTMGNKGLKSNSELFKEENNGIKNFIQCAGVSLEGKTVAQTVSLNPSATGGAFTFESSNKKATVDEDGIIYLPKYFCGRFTVTVTAQGEGYQKVSTSVTVMVKPSPTAMKSLKKSAKGAFTASWTKNPYVDGYELQYSKYSSFKKATTKKITKNKTVSKKVKKLKAKKTYYVRVRTYKKINGKIYRSKWTKGKKVKV